MKVGQKIGNIQKTTLYFLSMFVIMDIKEKKIWYRHKNALVSMNMWKLENPNMVFYYQNGDVIGGVPFTIGIQTLWQKTTLLKYGRDECISMDATFGANDLMYHLFTLVVFDEWHKVIPIALVITSRQNEDDIYDWLWALKLFINNEHLDWKPSWFIVDDAIQEREAIK